MLKDKLNKVWDKLFSKFGVTNYLDLNIDPRHRAFTYEIGRDHFSVNSNISVAGYKMSCFKSPKDLFDLIRPKDISHVIDFTERIGKYFIALFIVLIFTHSTFAQTDCSSALLANFGTNTVSEPSGPYWYHYTAAQTGTIILSSEGSGADTHLLVYDGCGGMLIADDVEVNTIGESKVVLSVTTGETIYFQWYFYIEIGDFVWSIRLPSSNVNTVDSLALATLYNATDGPNWENNTNWLSTPVDGWFGVGLSGSSVTSLILNDNNLTGTIPVEIGNLTNLKILNFSSNQIPGSIPMELSNLSNVIEINLRNTQLSGSIPPELGILNNLQQLILSNNQLTGNIPIELANITNLEYLNLSSNQLIGSIPVELQNLSNLTQLNLNGNQLTGSIPVELSNFAELSHLDVSSNQLTGSIPNELGVSGLRYLILSDNQLTGVIPNELGDLSYSFSVIDLSNNQLTGAIPSNLGNLVNLYWLDLSNNQLSGTIPIDFGYFSQDYTPFNILDLSNNQLTGLIPSHLSKLINLYELNLSGNTTLTGTVPFEFINLPLYTFHIDGTNVCEPSLPAYLTWATSIFDYSGTGMLCTTPINASDSLALVTLYNATDGANWNNNTNWLIEPVYSWFGVSTSGSNVIEVNLEDNNLVGTLPIELSDLAQLRYLILHSNQITGSIPPELGNLTNLEYLDLYGNQLTGTIPPELGNLTNLIGLLDLRYNQLTGPIPPELGNLTNLKQLLLSSNQLSGSIPGELGNLTNLEHLRLSVNQLTGTIPPELGGLSNLYYLGLISNSLTGSIPPELGNLSNLEYLRLYSNQLSGSIPPELGNLNSLLSLVLGPNQLTGTIPSELGDLTNLITLSLRLNQLTGSIPSELGNLSNLQVLSFRENQLTGNIPPELGNLTKLTELHLYGNLLTGTIPSELGNLSNLYGLYLYNNQLTGNIPSELGNLPLLNSLYLDENQLTGAVPAGFNNLTNLETLSLTGNQLSELPDLTALSNLALLEVSNNNFTFEDLEPNVGITGIVYAPQNNLTSQGTIELTNGETLNLSIPVGGTANLYQWSKDGLDITGATEDTYTVDIVSEDDEGNYFLNITNTLVSDLEINSEVTIVNVITNEVNVSDSLALVALYNSTNGSGWENNGNWLAGPALNWYGVVATDSRVTGLFLSNNNLTGNMSSQIGVLTKLKVLQLNNNQLADSVPSELSECKQLQVLHLQNNNLTYLPELELEQLNDFNITNNRFTFTDIVPNLDLITGNEYQQPVGESFMLRGYYFEDLRIDPEFEFAEGQGYQWYKDTELLTDGNNAYYDLYGALEEDGGDYILEITHIDIPGFVLTREPIMVEIGDGNPPKPKLVEVVSPNGDGINDAIIIKNIELYPDHRVLIYNGLGRLVFETTNYDNINNPFIGIGNANGYGRLPSGTYYYLVDVGDTKRNGTGFFIMKRK